MKRKPIKFLENFIEKSMVTSRWLLVIFYGGLATGLAIYAVYFLFKLWNFAIHIIDTDSNGAILGVLGLIDAALIASLVIMVIISSYESFVNRFDFDRLDVRWIGSIDSDSLKVKVAMTIIAISSIHLLQIFLNLPQHMTTVYASELDPNLLINKEVFWYTILHITFIASGIFLAITDRVNASKHHAEQLIQQTSYKECEYCAHWNNSDCDYNNKTELSQSANQRKFQEQPSCFEQRHMRTQK